MLGKLSYKVGARSQEAKLSTLTNPVRQSDTTFPGTMFDIELQEDLDAVVNYYFNNYPHECITGFVIPFEKLSAYSPTITRGIPKDALTICNIRSEAWFFGHVKEEVASYYRKYNLIPVDVRSAFDRVAGISEAYFKAEEHRKLWSEIVRNQTPLFQLERAFVFPQVNSGMRVSEAVAPFLVNSDHIDLNREANEYANKLLHTTDESDLENQGQLVAYTAHLHKSFLRKSSNVTELISSINDSKNLKAVTLKLPEVEDIRELPDLIGNYNALIMGLRAISDDHEVPVFYLSTHTEGLVATARGIDAFSQPFNRDTNLPTRYGATSASMKLRWANNPKFPSGKIYDYVTKEMVTRQDFESMMERRNGGTVNAPVGELSRYTLEQISQMTFKNFRSFSKQWLMAVRNLEVGEVRRAVNDGTIRTMRSKFSTWLRDTSLFPPN